MNCNTTLLSTVRKYIGQDNGNYRRVEMNVWENTEVLERLEGIRANKRKYYGRLAFDCFHCKVSGDKAFCEAAHAIGTAKDGSALVTSVLQGRTSSFCKTCQDFDE